MAEPQITTTAVRLNPTLGIMAEIIKLKLTSKTTQERRRRLRNVKRAAEVLCAELETDRLRRAVGSVLRAIDELYDGELSPQDANIIMAAARVMLQAVRLDI
jgi:hypothetical protein